MCCIYVGLFKKTKRINIFIVGLCGVLLWQLLMQHIFNKMTLSLLYFLTYESVDDINTTVIKSKVQKRWALLLLAKITGSETLFKIARNPPRNFTNKLHLGSSGFVPKPKNRRETSSSTHTHTHTHTCSIYAIGFGIQSDILCGCFTLHRFAYLGKINVSPYAPVPCHLIRSPGCGSVWHRVCVQTKPAGFFAPGALAAVLARIHFCTGGAGRKSSPQSSCCCWGKVFCMTRIDDNLSVAAADKQR